MIRAPNPDELPRQERNVKVLTPYWTAGGRGIPYPEQEETLKENVLSRL